MESNKIRIDIKECLKDSPKFRMHLEEEETDVDHLEQKLERIIKLCTTSVEAGKEYVKNQSQFATSLWDLQKHFLNNKSAHNALTKIVHCMQEVNKYQTILLDQQFQICVKNLSTFLKKDIKEVKECKNLFTKVSDNLDLALNKNSQANKNRTQEVLETENFLSATRSCFHHTSIDYINHITLLQCKKQPEVLSTLLTYMQAFVTYFHQGSDLSEDYASFFKTVDDDITTMRSEYNQLEKTMQNRHSYVNEFIENQANSWSSEKPEERPGEEASPNPNPAVQDMEGYLFKRTSNAFKTWNRRWFCMKNHQLFYRKRTGDEPLPTVMEDDLRLCSVRPVVESDRRFCFAVISPTKYHILQADSEVMLQAWIRALQKGIDTAIQSGSSFNTDMCKQTERNDRNAPPARAGATKGKKINWTQILLIPGNHVCCDCGSNQPKWSSINLGITLCIACSGIHRSLGVHYSKVRSLTLDVWEPEILRVMTELGNSVVNAIYEGKYYDQDNMSEIQKASENCDQAVREAWIKAKYIDRRFIPTLIPKANMDDNRYMPGKWCVKKFRRSYKKIDADDVVTNESLPIDNQTLIVGDDLVKKFGSLPDNTNLLSDQEAESDEEHDDEVGGTEFVDMSELCENMVLYKAAGVHNLPVMCLAIARGADKNWCNAKDLDRTPLHQTVLSGSIMACEYLLLNGSKIDTPDRLGYTALHLATEKGHTAQAYLLLKHKAKHDIETKDGKRPIDIAVKLANADIVTLLRLTQLNEEIGEDPEDSGIDATYLDVMKDFSHLTSSNQLRSGQKAKAEGGGACGSETGEGSI